MAAKESFEGILSSKAVPNHTKAMTLKQLGTLSTQRLSHSFCLPFVCLLSFVCLHFDLPPSSFAILFASFLICLPPFCLPPFCLPPSSGWLYHTVPEISATTSDPHTKATELLTLAVGANPSSAQAWYFLGRCHAHQGSVHEAFLAYQYAISKAEDSQADTWCSIG